MADPRKEVRWFARKMEDELRENDGKGHWDNCEDSYLIRRLGQEVEELRRALKRKPRDARLVISEAADVANFAMMIADNWSYILKADEAESPTPRDEGGEP